MIQVAGKTRRREGSGGVPYLGDMIHAVALICFRLAWRRHQLDYRAHDRTSTASLPPRRLRLLPATGLPPSVF